MRRYKHIFILLFLTSCVSNRYFSITGYDYHKITTYQKDAYFSIEDIYYTELSDGIEIARLDNETIPLIATVAKINLKNPLLKILNTEKTRFNKKGFVLAESTMSFAKRNDTNLAINANFFTFKCSFLDVLYKPLGLYIAEGSVLSNAKPDFAQLIFTSTREPLFQKPNDDSNVMCAIAGFNQVLKNGSITITGRSKKIDSRTLIGINKEKDVLFILCVDGERKKISEGATLINATKIMQEIGAYEAIELDGGGSSSLIAKIDGVQHQLIPSSKKQFRKVATNLGFKIVKP
ncbi:MAG: phosphodiester glycosidase family protein [Treponema sp.]